MSCWDSYIGEFQRWYTSPRPRQIVRHEKVSKTGRREMKIFNPIFSGDLFFPPIYFLTPFVSESLARPQLEVLGSRAPNGVPKSTQNKAGEPDLGVFFLVILTPLSSGAANTSTLTPRSMFAMGMKAQISPVKVLEVHLQCIIPRMYLCFFACCSSNSGSRSCASLKTKGGQNKN